MKHLLGGKGRGRALDVATGGGHTARALAEMGFRVVSLDVTRPMLAALERGLGPVLGDAHAMPLRGASFDVVACRIAPHHFTDLARFVAEAARVLRPGGQFYTYDLASPPDPRAAEVIHRIESLRDPSHVRSYALAAWQDALARAGLRPTLARTFAAPMDLEAWLARSRMSRDREADVRRLLAAHPASTLGGYGLGPDATFEVLRVEVHATKP